MVDMSKKTLFFFSEAVDNDTLDEIISKGSFLKWRRDLTFFVGGESSESEQSLGRFVKRSDVSF